MRSASPFAESPRPAAEALLPIPSGPRGLPFFGVFFEFIRDPLGYIDHTRDNLGDLVEYKFGPHRFAFTHDPEHVQHVLVKNHKNYLKSRSYKGLRLVMGNGLVTSEGEFWRRQRRLSQPAFHQRRLETLADTMATCVDDMLQAWHRKTVRGPARVDVNAEMMRLTLGMVGRTLFGIDLTDDASALGPAITIALRRANVQAESALPLPLWVPSPLNLRFRRSKRLLDATVHRIIAERRDHGRDHGDLLSMLMAATDESGGDRMTDAQLRDEVMTLFLAGHETIATAMSWTWLLLTRHPEAAARVRAEVREAVGDRAVRFSDLPRLAYTGRVIDEAMRLYPPVWIIERAAIDDDVLGRHRIPRGTIVAISPWGLHHDPRAWPDPLRFDPDRFDAQASEQRPKYSYLPFGGGPRVCIGNHFALMEAKIIVAHVLRRFDVRIDDDPAPRPDPKVTLRPRGGMPGTIVRAAAVV